MTPVKNVLLGVLVGGLLLLGCACSRDSAATASPGATAKDQAARLDRVDLVVEGMTCGGCEVALKTKVRQLPGIAEVTADHEAGRATVVYDPSKTSLEAIVAAIGDVGYRAKPAASASRGGPST